MSSGTPSLNLVLFRILSCFLTQRSLIQFSQVVLHFHSTPRSFIKQSHRAYQTHFHNLQQFLTGNSPLHALALFSTNLSYAVRVTLDSSPLLTWSYTIEFHGDQTHSMHPLLWLRPWCTTVHSSQRKYLDKQDRSSTCYHTQHQQ